MKSVDLSLCIVKSRSGVRKASRYFTRNEKVRQIVAERERGERRSECIAAVLAEKERIRGERAEKERLSACRRAMLANPDLRAGDLKTDKDGNLYFQPRINGKFGKRVLVK